MRITKAMTGAALTSALVSSLPLRLAGLAVERWLRDMHTAGTRNAAAAVAEAADEHVLLDLRIAGLSRRSSAPLASVVG